MRARSMAVVFFALLAPTAPQPASAQNTCDCSVICDTTVANCKEDVKLERQLERSSCRIDSDDQVLGCQIDESFARNNCELTCGTELKQCLKDAKLTSRACAAGTSAQRKLCNAQADANAENFFAFCANELPNFCLSDCVERQRCTDGVRNGQETDVDCGGPVCGSCPDGSMCLTDFDCLSGACESGVCVTFMCNPISLSDPDTVNGDTTGGTSRLQGSCQSGGAPEVEYAVTAAMTGVLHVELDSTADLGVYVRTVCESQFTELGCADFVVSGTETLDVPVQIGQTLFVVVDGFAPGIAGPFTLRVQSLPSPIGPTPGPSPTPF